MRRRLVATAALIAVAASVLLAPAQAEEAPAPTDATVGPLISGTSSYVAGTYAWTDYAYDDRGADTNGRPGGDVAYPADVRPNNVADLIQLQLRPNGASAIDVTAVLETLTPATRPLLGVAFDRDGDTSTGGASLPGSWTAAAPLGLDDLFVLGAGGGQHLTTAADGWHVVGTFPVRVDPVANTVAATVPLPLPEAGTLRTVAVAGYEHGDSSWLDGSGPVHDLAFVDDGWVSTPYLQGVTDAVVGFVQGGGYWQDGVQAAILAGDADPAPAVATIDVQALRAGTTQLAEPEAGGFETFLYHSAPRTRRGRPGVREQRPLRRPVPALPRAAADGPATRAAARHLSPRLQPDPHQHRQHGAVRPGHA